MSIAPLNAASRTGAQTPASTENMIEVRKLRMWFPVRKGFIGRSAGYVKAVDDVSFTIKKGETLGLVGESGCGKTTVGRCILRVYHPTDGNILFDGQDISNWPEKKMQPLRRRMQLFFQDPYGSLNPRQTAGGIVGEPLKIHNLTHSAREYRARVQELFELVGINPAWIGRYPHEFSGGQRQRIGIARALACEPLFIVCDEPVSALDVSIQAQIINLLKELRDHLGLTYLFIAHDLSVVRYLSERVAVMYLGRIMELTSCDTLYDNPLHPYTKALLSAIPIPDIDVERKRKRIILPSDVPSPLNPPKGCVFHPRCREATGRCSETIPPLKDCGDGHMVACLNVNV